MIQGMLTPPAALEALLFASGEPLEKKRLTAFLGIRESELQLALTALTLQLDGHGISVIETKEKIELRTAPEAAGMIQKLRENELARDLGKASLETLAVVAYQEGATRSDIDWVRGVNSSASLHTLLMRGLIEGTEDPRDKRRIQYCLTTEALAHLGIARAEDLPRHAELKAASKRIIAEEDARATADAA